MTQAFRPRTGAAPLPPVLGKGYVPGNQYFTNTGRQRESSGDTAPAVDTAYEALLALLREWGLESLAQAVMTFLQDGYTQDQISVLLQDTPEYKQRFAGNEKRRQAGLRVLSPREYLDIEAAYRQILSSSGMPSGFYDSTSDFVDWIGSDVSPQEISSRVGLALDAANKLDDSLKNTFRDWFGLQPPDIAAFFLDQDRALPQIQKIAKAVQIGAGYARGGLSTSEANAETLAGFAGDRNLDQLIGGVVEATQGGNRLSSIYGGEDYGQAEAEQEVFMNSEQAKRKRQALVGMEQAQFSGSSGVGKSTLSKQKNY